MDDETIRLGVTDCGIISKTHVRAARDVVGVEVTAASSRNPDRVAAYCDEHGIPNRFTDWREMLASDSIDAVIICLPDGLHEPATLEAAKHSKHVLVEKPMANNLAQCHAMVSATDKAGVVLMVAQMVRQFKSHRLAKEMIQEGRIGAVARATRRRHWLLAPALEQGAKRPWFTDPDLCTDAVLFGLGSHEFDALLWLFESEAAEVVARGEKDFSIGPWWMSIDGSAKLRNGVELSVSMSVNAEEKVWDTRIEGSDGTMTLYEDRIVVKDEDIPDVSHADAFALQLDEFAQCVREGRAPGPSGKNVLATMAVLDGMVESLRTGESVGIEELGVEW